MTALYRIFYKWYFICSLHHLINIIWHVDMYKKLKTTTSRKSRTCCKHHQSKNTYVRVENTRIYSQKRCQMTNSCVCVSLYMYSFSYFDMIDDRIAPLIIHILMSCVCRHVVTMYLLCICQDSHERNRQKDDEKKKTAWIEIEESKAFISQLE